MGPSEEEESHNKSRDPFEGYRGVLDVLHVHYKSPKQLSAEIFGRNKSRHKNLSNSVRTSTFIACNILVEITMPIG